MVVEVAEVVGPLVDIDIGWGLADIDKEIVAAEIDIDQLMELLEEEVEEEEEQEVKLKYE